jgi:hypothetical protein
MDALDGDTAIDNNTGAVIVSGTEALIEPSAAVMFVAPCARPEASPAPFTVATAGTEDFQVTETVRSCMVPSLYVPVAANCCVFPAATLAMLGEIVIETRTAGATLSVADPLIGPEVAVMLVEPVPVPTASPPAIDATCVMLDAQVADEVRSCVLPSV